MESSVADRVELQAEGGVQTLADTRVEICFLMHRRSGMDDTHLLR